MEINLMEPVGGLKPSHKICKCDLCVGASLCAGLPSLIKIYIFFVLSSFFFFYYFLTIWMMFIIQLWFDEVTPWADY